MLAQFRDWIARHADQYALVTSADELLDVKIAGKLGICFDIEGMDAVASQPNLVRLYYDLGVRWMLIAYNRSNVAGGGCLDEDRGLTAFGRRIIAEMNAIGMMVCCSHAGYRTAREAIDASSKPVIFSHSNPRAMWDHPRNIPDDLMRACAGRGGVIGLNGVGLFLGRNDARIDTFVAHVEHALDVVGEDHVGIGLDYAFDQDEVAQAMAAKPEAFPAEFFPHGTGVAMMGPWTLPDVARAMVKRGHSQPTLAKMFGGNLWRVASQVWA